MQCGECQASLQVQFRDQEVHQRERVIKDFRIWSSKFQNRHIGSQYSSNCLCIFQHKCFLILSSLCTETSSFTIKVSRLLWLFIGLCMLWSLLEYIGLYLNFKYVLIIVFIYMHVWNVYERSINIHKNVYLWTIRRCVPTTIKNCSCICSKLFIEYFVPIYAFASYTSMTENKHFVKKQKVIHHLVITYFSIFDFVNLVLFKESKCSYYVVFLMMKLALITGLICCWWANGKCECRFWSELIPSVWWSRFCHQKPTGY